MKKEMINSYLIQDPEVLIPMARDDFYKEQIEIAQKTGHPTRLIDVVAVLIFNTKGELLLQKRSPTKLITLHLLFSFNDTNNCYTNHFE